MVVGWVFRAALLAASVVVGTGAAGAQVASVSADPSRSPAMDATQDAAGVADRFAISLAGAARRLRLQQASVTATDAIAARFADRLAGIAVEHDPGFRIVVLLKGAEPVPGELLNLDGEQIPVDFIAGAQASRAELVRAISAHQATIRASLLTPPGLGVDQRTAELVAVVSRRDVAREGIEPFRTRLAALTGMPVRLRVVDEPALDMGGIAGGMRMMGARPGDPRQYLCTAGFVVTDGLRTGLSTAAHCPDTLRVRDAAGQEEVLPFAGQWGWGDQDVQINLSATALAPVFFADTGKTISRPVTGSRPRGAIRAGDIVCHRGERTGYSCSAVELTDFAPAGDLCGGACLPTWTTVAGPICRGGDSGAPVFLGTTAYGILKGGSYRSDGSCAFYFYMSTDSLPAGWRLLTADEESFADTAAAAGAGTTVSVP